MKTSNRLHRAKGHIVTNAKPSQPLGSPRGFFTNTPEGRADLSKLIAQLSDADAAVIHRMITMLVGARAKGDDTPPEEMVANINAASTALKPPRGIFRRKGA